MNWKLNGIAWDGMVCCMVWWLTMRRLRYKRNRVVLNRHKHKIRTLRRTQNIDSYLYKSNLRHQTVDRFMGLTRFHCQCDILKAKFIYAKLSLNHTKIQPFFPQPISSTDQSKTDGYLHMNCFYYTIRTMESDAIFNLISLSVMGSTKQTGSDNFISSV